VCPFSTALAQSLTRCLWVSVPAVCASCLVSFICRISCIYTLFFFPASARRNSPCIIFIDEIDAVGSSRNPKDFQMVKMTLNQLLVEMDGFASTEGVIVIGATNFPDLLDKALVRPGRFDRHISVPLPDVRGRERILGLHAKNVPMAAGIFKYLFNY